MRPKSPTADVPYKIDWTAWLGAETITSSSWDVLDKKSGLMLRDPSITDSDKKTQVYIRGGEIGGPYKVLNTITTATRRDSRYIEIRVAHRVALPKTT